MCGIIGVHGVPEASSIVAYALRALQHRGQEAAGIVSSDGKTLRRHRGQGLVEAVFRKINFSVELPGHSAVGQVRYSTAGDKANTESRRSIQPLMDDSRILPLAIVHNGNLENADELRLELERLGSICNSPSDTELFLHLIKRSHEDGLPERLLDCFQQVKGAYTVLLLTPDRFYAAVDPHGFRPLCSAPFRGGVMFASEPCAFDLFRIPREQVSYVEQGTLLEFVNPGLHPLVHRFGQGESLRRCIFEWIYFARPDSSIWGGSVSRTRVRIGQLLAKRSPTPGADLVIPVPDSAIDHALGYAEESGLKYGHGFVRSHYIGRTFIEPIQTVRVDEIRMKLNPDPGVVADKRLVVVDDSIVRGNTSRQAVALLREAGAKEIHLRIASPPVIHPCYWGIDTPTKEQLIAAVNPPNKIAELVGADSVEYLTIEDMFEAVGDPEGKRHCLTCFNCKHPTQP